MSTGIENILLGMIANGLTSLLMYLGHKGGKFLAGEELLKKIKQRETALQPILQNAAKMVAERIECDGPARMEEVCLFLASSEAEAIARQIYSTILSKDNKKENLELIQKEYCASFSLYVGINEERLANLSKILFGALIAGCEQSLSVAIDEGILSAHEAKSTLRYRIILDELASIQKNLDFLTGKHKANIKDIFLFEKKYRQQITNRHGFIIPPHFDAARKLQIDMLYVKPCFIAAFKKRVEESSLQDADSFLSSIYRAVLLGNPGGGKSTFVSKLCYDLAMEPPKRLFGGRQLTPIPVILRDYGAEKKVHKCSILQFIEVTANSKYQVQPPPYALEYLLLNGHCAVIFDGLDELLDTSYRQEISNDVESFCSLYPSVPVLVTSREVGYEQAPLDHKKFELFRLAPFNDDQVKEYVIKWFAADADLSLDQQKQKSGTFLSESRIVPDLRSNPLMLALMCNIYRGENYIPKNRPDVYEKCSIMLFERWDKSRGIYLTLPFEAHIRPAMMYLAYWIYSDGKLQTGVTEENLIAKATEYLCPRRFEDHDEAEKAASEFIDFCRGRAWVFTDTGTTKEGKRLFQFTHRTFLEYFTAGHLVRTHPTPDKIIIILLPKIRNREWDVVAQLAFQVQNKNVEGAGDELLTELIFFARDAKDEKDWNLLSFAARCLEFMVPSPRVIRDIIVKKCIDNLINWGLKRMTGDLKRMTGMDYRKSSQSDPEEILYSILNATYENRVTIADSLEKLLISYIDDVNEEKAVLSAEIGLNLHLGLYYKPGTQELQNESFEFWNDISNNIFSACSGKIEELSQKYCQISFISFARGKSSIMDIIKYYGINGIFSNNHYFMFPNLWNASAAWMLIWSLLREPYLSKPKTMIRNYVSDIQEVGQKLLSIPTPWLRNEQVGQFFPHFLKDKLYDEQLKDRAQPSSGTLFGAFAILAVMLEAIAKKTRKTNKSIYIFDKKIEDIIINIKKSSNFVFDFLRLILISRFEYIEPNKVQAEIDASSFTVDQKAIIWKWIKGEINFVH